MTACRRAAGRLLEYSCGEISQPARDWVEGHLARCPLCALEFDAYLRVVRLGRRLPSDTLPVDLACRLLNALDSYIPH
jgi:anti-sigma factor RsiW